ncbi:long-chain-acyl-CoA synthetase [Marinobacterium sediminicola]|uniref:Fatty-acyl-CoA synthase n=1 Tax=Marinobacterium sediminicola TaxID=518898 RepID=A0ABY1S498_9GAMM|nr:long-chain-acyl-CoA synthetase [Marinobacterium sediminicola]ULG70188.1 long-chain-acyl-CoA synthetase [Marinobacterium sediminicola]SMR78341.1 fatty-acyl-CoA synthase [Marinobacterium sediminicola]
MSSNQTAPSPAVVPREETQRKLDRRSQAAALIKPADRYTIADRVEQQAETLGDHPFIIYGDTRLSYAELNARANQVAHAALACGLKSGDVCGMAMENRPEFFTTWFGLTKIGVVVAFINNQINGRPLQHALESTDAKAVIVGEECAHLFAQTPDLNVPQWLLPDAEKPAAEADLAGLSRDYINALETASREQVDKSHRADITAETPTLLIFTSGTTGLPKAAIYSHMRWLCSGDVMEVTVAATPDDVFYCFLPLYHGAAATSLTSTALKAGSTILLRRKFSVSRFWSDVREHNVTVCQYIGEICRYLLNQETDCGEHKMRAMVGAGLTNETWSRWIERFGQMDVYEGWGSTEANTNLINVDNYIGSCGRVPDWNKTNLRLIRYDVESDSYVRDENGYCVQCQPGEVGEAVGMIINHPEIGGGRFEGYTSRDATEQKILRGVFSEGDSWWRSGDLLRYDEDGYFYFVDRVGDTFRWKSENVSTQEVAAALGDFTGVELINVYGVRVPDHEGRGGMAAIVMQEGAEFDPQAFYDLTEERIPRYAAPLFVRVSEAADMTTTFKLRKVDLQRQGYSPEHCKDPLYIRDDKAGTYKPYSADALAAVGLPPFEYQ